MADVLQRLLRALMELECAVTRLVDQMEDDFEDLSDVFDGDDDER